MDNKLFIIINTVLRNNDLPLIEMINPVLSLSNDLGLDSIMLAELTVRIEDEFEIDVFEDGMVYTIGDILSKIEK